MTSLKSITSRKLKLYKSRYHFGIPLAKVRGEDGQSCSTLTPLNIMISWASTLFIIGLIALALGFGGVGSIALNIGWVLLGVGVILAIIHAISGRRGV